MRAATRSPMMPRRATIQITVHPDGRVSRKDAAEYLGLSAKTLAERQRKGLRPHSVKVGGRRFYFLQELDSFVNQ
jgi:hypothetical protein